MYFVKCSFESFLGCNRWMFYNISISRSKLEYILCWVKIWWSTLVSPQRSHRTPRTLRGYAKFRHSFIWVYIYIWFNHTTPSNTFPGLISLAEFFSMWGINITFRRYNIGSAEYLLTQASDVSEHFNVSLRLIWYFTEKWETF